MRDTTWTQPGPTIYDKTHIPTTFEDVENGDTIKVPQGIGYVHDLVRGAQGLIMFRLRSPATGDLIPVAHVRTRWRRRSPVYLFQVHQDAKILVLQIVGKSVL